MNILAMDTATTDLGLCLKSASCLRIVVLEAGLKHSEKLMPAVRSLLLEAGLSGRDLDLIICSTGPGSFTGIRIGLATAKGLAAGATAGGKRCLLMGVSTLDGLAHRYRFFPGTVAAVNPSLRKKHYAAVYRAGLRVGDYLETTLADLAAALKLHLPLFITGRAAAALREQMLAADPSSSDEIFLDASGRSSDPAGLLACGEQRLAEQGPRKTEAEVQPLYLRKSEAEITFFGGG
jgi:tRNA threonylcarbamoyladenosine biosynthesis protein TsaB